MKTTQHLNFFIIQNHLLSYNFDILNTDFSDQLWHFFLFFFLFFSYSHLFWKLSHCELFWIITHSQKFLHFIKYFNQASILIDIFWIQFQSADALLYFRITKIANFKFIFLLKHFHKYVHINNDLYFYWYWCLTDSLVILEQYSSDILIYFRTTRISDFIIIFLLEYFNKYVQDSNNLNFY